LKSNVSRLHQAQRHRVTAPPPPRWLTTLAWLSLGCTVVVLFGVWPLMGGDLWMWLTVGRYTWEHGGPPQVDVFSYVTQGQGFIAHS